MPDFGNGIFAVLLADVAYERKTLRVGAEFCKQRVVREVVHVGKREQGIVQCRHAEQHVAVGIPGIKTHAARFVLGSSFGKPERLQREGNHCREILCGAFVIVVRVADLETVQVRWKLACVFDAD